MGSALAAGIETLATAAERWLASFESALAAGDGTQLRALFHEDSHWRDVLALTWKIGTVSGADSVAQQLIQHAAAARPRGFRVDPERTAPREVTRAGTKCVEAIFRFETNDGPANGVLRFFADKNGTAALTLLTALDDLKGR